VFRILVLFNLNFLSPFSNRRVSYSRDSNRRVSNRRFLPEASGIGFDFNFIPSTMTFC